MKFVTRNQSKKFINSLTCTIYDYTLTDKLGLARAEIVGRYPKIGMAINAKCTESAYIIKGSGKIIISGKTIKIKEGDVALIKPKEKFAWDGKMTLLIATTPAWTKKQYKIINT